MSLHQIIYTSCMRGINGVNDGQQVFSYDASFKDANNDEVKSLFSYQPPALEPGVIMTEEIALTLPKSFTYRKLDNGACALALNTYLGRDYMGSAGRFGNHLSHVVLADESDMQNYPCEFYGSSLLRDHMEFEEVNNPNRPDFLPEPILERGFAVDIDAVIDFLSVDDRIEIFKNMLHAVLAFESERKRVVICDEPENIIMWIAAIEYALPLKIALGINFSTYDFDPSLSAWKIAFIVKVVSTFVKDQRVSVNDLLVDAPLGQTYYGLVKAVYSKNSQNGFFLVTRILDEFASDCDYLVNMALNIEGMLLDLPNGNQEVASMWKYFGQSMVKYQQSNFSKAYSVLGSYQRYEQIYMLYSLAMSNAIGLAESQRIFSDHYKSFVTRDRDYAHQYGDQILNDYYRRLER